ncbi:MULTISPECIES: Dabb family protein [Paenibacillus]|uniref:Dabb family protein n=1 Tax=Paenibacillus campinasensis TaxID=66347 RepID=A0ABW9T2Z2_9BACL|nr:MULTISPECIES: Dabb family protein [Paenibacillus]MUG67659.1 Dabb family protein [Paenibacillus campinasensis]PAK55693.1 stress responsive protein [Paenibacillus sp. 7541]
MSSNAIIHSVIFSLKHEQGSEEEQRFLEDGRTALSAIPTVKNFQVFRQISPKNTYHFGFSMVFDSEADYEAYNVHPNHVAFVKERWEQEVTQFLEIDYNEM